MPATGSCLCGAFAYSWEGEHAAVLSCYCKPCRRSSGNTHSINVIVPESQFKVERGDILNYQRQGDSGKPVRYNSCSSCGGLLFVEAEAFPGVKIVKLGTIDQEDLLKESKPSAELYVRNRFDWCNEYSGATQTEAGS